MLDKSMLKNSWCCVNSVFSIWLDVQQEQPLIMVLVLKGVRNFINGSILFWLLVLRTSWELMVGLE